MYQKLVQSWTMETYCDPVLIKQVLVPKTMMSTLHSLKLQKNIYLFVKGTVHQFWGPNYCKPLMNH